MKTPLLVALALAAAPVLRSDVTGLVLINQLPLPPANFCQPAPEAEAEFHHRLTVVSHDIDLELRKRNKQQKAYVKQHEEEWKEQMMKQAGLTPEQVAALKATKANRKKAAATRRQIANEVLQQQTDLSIDEIKKVDKMSPAAKEAWTQAYANQAIATAKANAQSRTDEQVAKDEQERQRLGRMAKLAEEQKKLMDLIGAPRDVIRQKMLELDKDAAAARQELVGPIELQLTECSKEVKTADEDFHRAAQQYKREDGQALSHEQAEAYGELMKQHEERLRQVYVRRDSLEHEKTVTLQIVCARFSPVYVGLIGQYLQWAKSVQADFERYEEMDNERLGLQMKTPGGQLTAVVGTLGLEEAKACVDLLASSDKYASEYRNRRTELSDAARSGAEP